MATKYIVLVVLCAASVQAEWRQNPRGCCMPDYESYFGGQGGLVYRDTNKVYKMITQGKLGQDFSNQRMYVRENVTLLSATERKVQHVRFIADYNAGTAYTIIKNKCYRSELPDRMNACLPSSAFLMTTYFGMKSSSSLSFSIYNFDVEANEPVDVDGDVTIDVTADACVPFGENISGEHANKSVTLSMGFAAPTGIRDPSEFVPPAICDDAPAFDGEHSVMIANMLILHDEHLVQEL